MGTAGQLARLPAATAVRAKHLSDTERARGAFLSHLNASLDALGFSSAAIAEELGVTPVVVRDIRAGARPLTASMRYLRSCVQRLLAGYLRMPRRN